MPALTASLKLLAVALVYGLVALSQPFVLLMTKGRKSYIIPQWCHWAICRIVNIRVLVHGDIHREDQTLYVSNHLSYLDIPVIGSIVQPASFVAKADVEGWPIFGFLGKMQQTIYISRARAASRAVNTQLEDALAQQKSLVIFPEGTSTDGKTVYPFKSSLFSVFFPQTPPESYSPNLTIQPFTINIDQIDGQDLTSQDIRDLYTWHIDMDTELMPHLWRFAKTKGAIISLTFAAPFKAHSYEDRKILAKVCHDSVSKRLKNKAAPDLQDVA